MNRENRVTIIVPDGMVYFGANHISGIDLSTLAEDEIRVVQWQEKEDGVGHIEMNDYTNVSIDAEGFSQFLPIVENAKAVFDAKVAEEAAAAAALAALQQEIVQP